MRIYQTMAGAPAGGAEAFFERLTVALQEAGVEQRVAVRHEPGRVGRLRTAGVEVEEMRFGGPLDLRTGPRLQRSLTRYRPEVVLAWMSRAAAVTPPGPWTLAARLGGYYDMKYFRRCDHLVGNTPGIVSHCIDGGWPAKCVHLAPNFVEAAPAPPADRAALATEPDRPLLLALGRLHRNKAFDVLLLALTALPRAVLWLAGEGPERAALERMAGELGVADRVRFLGWRQNVAGLLAAADVLVCPSRHEPLGNVVLEGFAHGVPVVAAAGDGPSWLIEDGVSGLLVPVDAPEPLAVAIGRVLDEPALGARLAAGGQARWMKSFTREAVVARYLELLAEIGSGR